MSSSLCLPPTPGQLGTSLTHTLPQDLRERAPCRQKGSPRIRAREPGVLGQDPMGLGEHVWLHCYQCW